MDKDEAPTVKIRARAGLKTDLDDERSVRIALGEDEAARRMWAVACMNKGHELRFALSQDAMSAIVQGYFKLSALDGARDKGVGPAAEWTIVPTPTKDTPHDQ